jgi:hypothetical protein
MAGKYNRKDLLDALFFTYCRDKGGFILVKISDRHMVKTTTRYFPTTDSLVKEQYAEDQNVLFGVCPREKMKPGSEHVRHLTAVWAGFDIGPDGYSGKEKHFLNEKQAIMAVKSFPLEPSAMIQSGRGFHLYWLLKEFKEVTDVKAVEEVLRRVSDFFQCASEVNLDATLRLPETWNPKHAANPTFCRVHHIDTSAKYHFDEFESLDLRVIIPSKRAPRVAAPLPPPLATRRRVTVIHDSSEAPELSTGPAEPGHTPEVDWEEIVSGGRGPVEAHQQRTSSADEKLVEQFLDGFSDRLLDKLADRIVDKLIERLPSAGKR